jgi:hypothetical protein
MAQEGVNKGFCSLLFGAGLPGPDVPAPAGSFKGRPGLVQLSVGSGEFY